MVDSTGKGRGARAAALVGLLLVTSCVGTGKAPDYRAFIEHMPGSILVLPPLDDSPEGNASYAFLRNVTRPLAERGYYVFPVAMVVQMMRDNGLPEPWDMHQVPLDELREVFDPDAVLYLTIEDWGTSYRVISSDTTVAVTGRLVDADTGATLWSGSESARESSGGGNQGLVGMLAYAIANQITTSISDPSDDLARHVSWSLIGNSRAGLLPGPRHPEHEKGLQAARKKAEP